MTSNSFREDHLMSQPRRLEIEHRTIKLILGLIALSLASTISFLSSAAIISVSDAYHYGHWPRDILVGSLFAIAAFMAAYNGFSTREMVLTKIAAFAALGVALFPCRCGTHDEIIPTVHGLSAAAMFLILAELCRIFYLRAKGKHRRTARRRAWVYAACGLIILVCIAIPAADYLLHGAWVAKIPRLVFYCEQAALIAFGFAWLAASHIIPGLADPAERWGSRSSEPTSPAGMATDRARSASSE